MLPLEGKRVLSFETWGSGAFHAEILAMLGAEVINIEDPEQDENIRRKNTLRSSFEHCRSIHYSVFRKNKKNC